MTAYILTPEQRAQILDALEYSTPIAEFDDMQSEATAQIEHNTALAMLKAMKPVEVCDKQFQGRDGAWYGFHNDKHYADTLADGTWPIRELYAKEQQ